MSTPASLDPDALATHFWAANAGLLKGEGKLAFARRARAYFEAAAIAAGAAPSALLPERERFMQAVLALHAGGEGGGPG